jgi:hypothetical protein
MIMATKKSMRVLLGILVVSTWVLASAIQTGAETMKCKIATTTTKDESVPVGDEEGHSLHLIITEGLAFFENGEIAKVRSHNLSDRISAKGSQVIGYTIYTFEDGSTIVQRFQRLMVSGDLFAKATGELIKGTGRFGGIKGTVSGTSKSFPGSKGEASRNTSDMTFTYTLPTK